MKVNATIKTKKLNYYIDLPLILFKEDNTTILYSPALDLYGYGTNKTEAEQSFSISLKEFIKYTENKDTFSKALEQLGWKTSKTKYIPPKNTDLIKKNVQYSDIINNKDFSMQHKKISIPVLA